MKKFLLIFLCLALCFSLIACDSETDGPPVSNSGGKVCENERQKIEAFFPEKTSETLGMRLDHVEYENDRYYYYFYLGTVKQVPVYSSVAMQYNYDTEVTIAFSSLSQESLSQTVSKAAEVVDTHSYTGGFEIAAAVDLYYAEVGAATDHHWTNNWGTTISESKSTISSYVKDYSEGYSEKVTFSEEAGFEKGKFYRMSFYETVKAYGVLIYDVSKNTYSSSSYAFMEKNSTVRVWEESADATFEYETSGELDFNEELAQEVARDYTKKNPPSAGGNLKPPVAKTAYVDTRSLSCALDNGYNYDKPDKNGNKYHYSHDFMMGQFVIEGGSYSNKTVTTVEGSTISIGFRLEYAPGSLPVQDTMTSRYVCKDGKFSNLYNMPWAVGERTVGYGMLVALISYEDGTPSDKICIENVFKDKKQGDVINIKSGIDKPCTVTIAIIYEVEMWAPGFLGISDNYWMNWRINDEFKVASPAKGY